MGGGGSFPNDCRVERLRSTPRLYSRGLYSTNYIILFFVFKVIYADVRIITYTDVIPSPSPSPNLDKRHNMTRSYRRGYYASVSWTDYLIGQLLDALDDAKVASNTVVALIGDHGWQLGAW